MNINILQHNIGYFFIDLKLLNLSLTHCSSNVLHNQRLEFLGDTILNSIISIYLYNKFPNYNEGNLTLIRSFLVKKKTLSMVARNLKINKFLKLGNGELKNNGYNKNSILANTIEAIVGAIYLDIKKNNNIIDSTKTLTNILVSWFKYFLKLDFIFNKKDYKTKLQELLQNNKLLLPIYKVINSFGKPHKKTFIVECLIIYNNKKIVTIGNGNNIKQAEQNSAKKILNFLKNNKYVKNI